MSVFIDWLEDLGARESRVRAVLRRSLSFEPGKFPSAYPYVEPFVKNVTNEWRRSMYYLTAGVWAAHWRTGRSEQPMTIGQTCAAHQAASGSMSTERRFIALLDADTDQLPHRLRQLVALLKDYPLDFGSILTGLLSWTEEGKPTQNQWARDFYRSTNITEANEIMTQEENA